jgi:TusE/DsrC/DsvC family sulfur relay protein
MDMPVLDTIDVRNRKIEVDEDGCLVNMDDWNESVAGTLAERMGMGKLTDDKLAMLKFIREHYKKYGFFPILRAVCKSVNKPRDCMTEEFRVPLAAWKLAGLPHPEEPLIGLLEAGQSPT